MAAISYNYCLPYILVFSLLVLSSIPVTTLRTVRLYTDRFQELFICFLLVIFIGLRGFIYTDWTSYFLFFQKAPTLYSDTASLHYFFNESIFSSWEPGLVIIGIFCKSIVNDWYFFQLIIFLIDFVLLLLFFRTVIPRHIIMGLCFYFIFKGEYIEVNLLRNAKSIILFICSLKYITEKKIIPYMLLNILGCFFHASAILFIPLYFFLGRKQKKEVILFLFLIGNVLYLSGIHWSAALVGKIAYLIGGRMAERAFVYLNSASYSVGTGITIGFMERTFSFCLAYKYYYVLIKEKSINIILMNCFFIYLFVFLFFSDLSIITGRIPDFFIFAYWVIFPQIYDRLSATNKKLFLVILLLYGILKLLMSEKYAVCAYDNFFFPKYSIEQRQSNFHRFSK